MAVWPTLRSGARARPLARGVALIVASLAGVVAGCPLELDRNISCGDGWWDPEYEECDPRDPQMSHREACRDQDFAVDAHCDRQTCQILDSERDCTSCGDGIASDTEECDGDDLRGQTCSAGSGALACHSDCTLDRSACPEVCGDDFVSGSEECEPNLSCADDSDCPEGRLCYGPFGECVSAGDNFAPNLACSNYSTKAISISKPYASGKIDRCTDECFFGRNDCSFCGDGELDGQYSDFVFPNADSVPFPAEVCDGENAQEALLQAHCEPLCINDPINSDVVVLCDFECSPDCLGFAGPTDVVPGENPEALGCCLAKGSPCPNFGNEGVPEFPCCSWLDKPAWYAEMKCVLADTNQIPISYVCP